MQVLRTNVKLCSICACVCANDDWSSVDSFPIDEREGILEAMNKGFAILEQEGDCVCGDEGECMGDCEVCGAEDCLVLDFSIIGD